MRRLLKFLHELGAVGLMGGSAALIVLMSPALPASPPAWGARLAAMSMVAGWVYYPALVATLVAGLLAIAVNPAFHNAGWAWAKAATGILIFEGGLHALGPIQEEAKRSLGGIAATPSDLGKAFAPDRSVLWVILAVSTANVVLGVWRPHFGRRR